MLVVDLLITLCRVVDWNDTHSFLLRSNERYIKRGGGNDSITKSELERKKKRRGGRVGLILILKWDRPWKQKFANTKLGFRAYSKAKRPLFLGFGIYSCSLSIKPQCISFHLKIVNLPCLQWTRIHHIIHHLGENKLVNGRARIGLPCRMMLISVRKRNFHI